MGGDEGLSAEEDEHRVLLDRLHLLIRGQGAETILRPATVAQALVDLAIRVGWEIRIEVVEVVGEEVGE
jgi:hypothetical protein